MGVERVARLADESKDAVDGGSKTSLTKSGNLKFESRSSDLFIYEEFSHLAPVEARSSLG